MERSEIGALIPHQGSMRLLERVISWDEDHILCETGAHLLAGNPLRRDGRLSAVTAIEFAMQAAAVHGGLRAGGARQPVLYLAGVSELMLKTAFLDEPGFGRLQVSATALHRDGAGAIYQCQVADQRAAVLARFRGIVMAPRAGQDQGA
jgi:predicted hotdog family 3-hydroxylacyl-ACP dehydratase